VKFRHLVKRPRSLMRRAAALMRRAAVDRGAASILVLAIGLLMVASGLAGAAIGNTRIARHRAHNAADLGALAGAMHAAYGEPAACAQAARLVTANGGHMTECTVAGLEIVVHVQVEVHPLPGLVRRAEAVARAGPVYVLPG
jgi:secretion/DNA translocation related TadE-like protein